MWGLKWLAMAVSVDDMTTRDCDASFLVVDGGMLEVLRDSELENGLLHVSTSRSFVAVGWSSSTRERK